MAAPQQIYVELKEGVKMPVIGLGTSKVLNDEEMEKTLNSAYDAGYRHFDTAFGYKNEKVIGKILKKWFDSGKVKREELFIVTKLPKVGMRPSGVVKYLQASLDNLGLSYVDLYLVHSPFGYYEKKDNDPKSEEVVDVTTDHVAIWKAMEDQVIAGKTRTIGLSNFNEKQIERVWSSAERVKPAVLQVELHLYFQQKELVKFCKSKNIKVCAYAPLGSGGSTQYLGKDLPNLLDIDVVKEIAKKYNKTPAQILLRHIVQRGIITIPKSTNPGRITQNIQVFDFDLSDEEVKHLDAQDKGRSGRLFDFFFFKGATTHPEYPF